MKRYEFFINILALNLVSAFVEKFEDSKNFAYIFIFLYLPISYLFINFFCKRVRDIGLSGWWALIPVLLVLALGALRELALAGELGDMPIDEALVPAALVVAIVLLLLPLYLWPSQKLKNKYGVYSPFCHVSAYRPLKKPKAGKRRAI